MTPEAKATEVVRLSAPIHNSRIFRNNSGACVDDTGRLIRYGLGNTGEKNTKNLKFGDYIGITSIIVTPDMVGQTIGVFTNLEIKPDGHMQKTLTAACSQGTREYYQWQTCQFVKSLGGFGGFVCNENDVKEVLTWTNK